MFMVGDVMNYRPPVNFITPTRAKGALVLESDDGFVGDYAWHAITMNYTQNLQFRPHKPELCKIKACFAWVSGLLNTAGFLNNAQVNEIIQRGHEIMSHTKDHTGLGYFTFDALAGTSVLNNVTQPDRLREPGRQYLIWNGNNEETVTIANISGSTVTVQETLQHNYPSGSNLRLSEAEMRDQIEGNKAIFEGMGLVINNFVSPYYHKSSLSKQIVQESFNSDAGGFYVNSDVPPNNPRTVDRYGFVRHNSNVATSLIDSLLDDVYQQDLIMIIGGHGDNFPPLRYIIQKAIEKNIPIMTKQEVLEHYGML